MEKTGVVGQLDIFFLDEVERSDAQNSR